MSVEREIIAGDLWRSNQGLTAVRVTLAGVTEIQGVIEQSGDPEEIGTTRSWTIDGFKSSYNYDPEGVHHQVNTVDTITRDDVLAEQMSEPQDPLPEDEDAASDRGFGEELGTEVHPWDQFGHYEQGDACYTGTPEAPDGIWVLTGEVDHHGEQPGSTDTWTQVEGLEYDPEVVYEEGAVVRRDGVWYQVG